MESYLNIKDFIVSISIYGLSECLPLLEILITEL